MKKVITLLLAMLLVFSLVACGNSANNNNAVEANNVTEENNTNEPATEVEEEVEELNMRPFVAASADFNGDFYPGWTNSTYDVNIQNLVWGFGLMTDNAAGEIVDSPLVAEKTVSEDLTE